MQVLFELGVEELPESEVFSIEKQLESLAREIFEKYRIKYRDLEIFVAARRMGLLVDLDERQEDMIMERRGPASKVAFDENGNPTRALEGFLRSCGVTLDDVEVREEDKGSYVYAVIRKPGRRTEELLPEIVSSLIEGLHFTKPMKWGVNLGPFVRPVHWIVLMMNDKVVDFSTFGVKADRLSSSHRYLNTTFTIDEPSRYFDLCLNNMVIPRVDDRRARVHQCLREIEETHGVHVVKDEELIDEVVALTEYPTAFLGRFSEEFLELPKPVVETALKHHQRVFAVLKNGQLKNAFVAFVDGPESLSDTVSLGYSRVINARLDDARFYFERDRKHCLEEFVKRLEGVVFQHELGTLKDKVERVRQLSSFILSKLGDNAGKLKSLVDRAALLSKADTATMLVYEFPELQGIVGRIYASMDGEPEEVCQALEEQYMDVPSGVVGAILSIADKVDTVAGNFAVGNIPSGSRDPYGLKRKATSVLKTLIEFEWDISLEDLLKKSLELLRMHDEATLKTLYEFFKTRLEVLLEEEKGFDYDIARCTLALSETPFRAFLSANVIQEIKNTSEYNDLLVGFERVFNITRNHSEIDFDPRRFIEKAEFELFDEFVKIEPEVLDALDHLDYREAVRKLASLRPHIDRYFDSVFVMDKDLSVRMNRLSFLKRLALLFKRIGDLNELEKIE